MALKKSKNQSGLTSKEHLVVQISSFNDGHILLDAAEATGGFVE